MPYTIEELRRIITPIAQAHGLRSVSLFGSYSKGTARRDSDVDLKIEKGGVMSLFQLSSLRLEMEDALKVPVDLVTNDSSDHEFLNLIAKDELLLWVSRKLNRLFPDLDGNTVRSESGCLALTLAEI